MTIIYSHKGSKITIKELPDKKYTVTIELKRGVSVTRNGCSSIRECLVYAESVRKNFEKQDWDVWNLYRIKKDSKYGYDREYVS